VASPNLLTLGFLDLYPNPARVPVITSARNFNDALRCAVQGEGVAAIMRDKFWIKKPKKAKKGLKLFLLSKAAWPHRAFSVSKTVDPQTRARLRQAILSAEGAKHGRFILKQFKSKKFVPATQKEYEGLGRLLKPIWGFHDQ
jgi:ABC-type phosphate/phosphonate transport system substrate-binding protein